MIPVSAALLVKLLVWPPWFEATDIDRLRAERSGLLATITQLEADNGSLRAELAAVTAERDAAVADGARVREVADVAMRHALLVQEAISDAKMASLMVERAARDEDIKALQSDVERLKDVLHRDRSGLAAGIGRMQGTARGMINAVNEKDYDTADARGLVRDCVVSLELIESVGDEVLRASGNTAHAECCGSMTHGQHPGPLFPPDKRDAVVEALGMGTPWPVTEVLNRLADAGEHLLHDHACDAHGYEGVSIACVAARQAVKKLLVALAALVKP